MCGIAGYMGKGSQSDLREMIKSIRYRGPDDSGFLLRDNLGFGHARLSIIDLSPSGHQPMLDKEQTVAVIFNGEIYNFKELKKELKNYQFASNSDTETIICAYKKYGEKCFEKLDGMFAIALYDFKNKKLFLVRDRMGKKPLYWTYQNGTFVFASELHAILKHSSVKAEIDQNSLYKYLSYDYVPTPFSMIEGVFKLEAGTFLSFQNGQIKKEKFWKPEFKESNISVENAVSKLDSLIEQSVKSRLISDVPLGVFLSGGIDSTTVAYYAQKLNNSPINTYSIGFEETSFDESEYAKKAADFLKTNHHLKIFKLKEAIDRIPKILESLDEPNADASIVPTELLSEFARTGLTVALGGDGGDELFAGYPTFLIEKFSRLTGLMPKFVKQFVEGGAKIVKPSYENFGIDFAFKKFSDGWKESNIVKRHMRWLGSFTPEDKKLLLRPETLGKVGNRNEFEEAQGYFVEHPEMNKMNRLLYMYQRTYMMDEVLAKVDRASMRQSLEVRVPLLDYHVVEFVNSLPYSYKLNGLKTKYLLKKLMKGKIPDEIIDRKKKGFGMPIGQWFRKELKDYLNQVLSSESIKKAGIFNPEYVEKIKKEHFEGRSDHRKKLWSLLVFEVWRKKHLQ